MLQNSLHFMLKNLLNLFVSKIFSYNSTSTMDYKFYLILALALMGFVIADVEEDHVYRLKVGLMNAVETINYNDYNSIMWLHRMLTEKQRWDFWHLPSDVPESEGDFVRGITAYASAIFRSEIMHHWTYGTETEPYSNKKEEYAYRFNQKIVEPCKEVIDRVASGIEPFKQAELEGYPINLQGFPSIWLSNESACQRLVSDPKHWIELSYKVAEKNYLI